MDKLKRKYLELLPSHEPEKFLDQILNFLNIMVDLRKTERKILEKYMGRENAASFLQYNCDHTESLRDVA